MFEPISIYWRVLVTGFSFVAFGASGLLLRVLVFPLLNVLVWHREQRIVLARRVIRMTMRGFVGLMQTIGVLRYEIIGRQHLERGGLLIVANHPTLIDTVFLMAFVKNADCIVKAGLWNNPFTGGPVRSAGYILNNQGEGLMEDCIGSLEQGNNLIVFPEGTRTPLDGAISLQRGAANIAVRGARDMTPVVIRCEPIMLSKGVKWWRVPVRRPRFRIEVRDDIKINRFIDGGASHVMAARNLSAYLQTYFTEENERHA